MLQTIRNLERLITGNSISHQSDMEKKHFSASFRSSSENVTLVDITVEGENILFSSCLSHNLFGDDLNRAEQFIQAANSNFSMGSLQLDYNTGSVYFKVLCHLEENQEMTAGELAPYLFIVPMTAELYGKHGLDVMFEQNLSPEEAIQAVNSTPDKPVMGFVLPDPAVTFVRMIPPASQKQSRREDDASDDEDEENDFEDEDNEFTDATDYDSFEHGPLMDAVHDYYDAHPGWYYYFNSEDNSFQMRFHSEYVKTYHVLTVFPHDDTFLTITFSPLRIPKEKFSEAAEFVTRANFALTLGFFELNIKTGEFQFRDTCICGDIPLDTKSIEAHIEVGIRMMERYTPGLIDVLNGRSDPKAAIDKIEKKFMYEAGISIISHLRRNDEEAVRKVLHPDAHKSVPKTEQPVSVPEPVVPEQSDSEETDTSDSEKSKPETGSETKKDSPFRRLADIFRRFKKNTDEDRRDQNEHRK